MTTTNAEFCLQVTDQPAEKWTENKTYKNCTLTHSRVFAVQQEPILHGRKSNKIISQIWVLSWYSCCYLLPPSSPNDWLPCLLPLSNTQSDMTGATDQLNKHSWMKCCRDGRIKWNVHKNENFAKKSSWNAKCDPSIRKLQIVCFQFDGRMMAEPLNKYRSRIYFNLMDTVSKIETLHFQNVLY